MWNSPSQLKKPAKILSGGGGGTLIIRGERNKGYASDVK